MAETMKDYEAELEASFKKIEEGDILLSVNGTNVTTMDALNGAVYNLDVGDTVEVVGPDCKPFSMVVPEMRDAEGFTLLEPRNPRMIFTMQLPRSVPAMSFVRHAVDLSARD